MRFANIETTNDDGIVQVIEWIKRRQIWKNIENFILL